MKTSSKRILGTSVDFDNPPEKEDLRKAILNSARYQGDIGAMPEIDKAIKASGLYPADTAKPEQAGKPDKPARADRSAAKDE